MLRVQLQPGYVLSQRPYRESSALLEVLTRDHGRIGLVARGVRGSRTRLKSPLQSFRRFLLSWSEGGDLGTVSAVEPDGASVSLPGEAVFYGWYLNELLLRLLTRHDPHPALFALYESALQQLQPPVAEAALRIFEKRLLAELGYGLPLPAAIDVEAQYELDWEQGPRQIPAATASSYAGASLRALATEQLNSPAALLDAKRLLRTAIARQLGGRELETPKLLRELRRSTGQPGPLPAD